MSTDVLCTVAVNCYSCLNHCEIVHYYLFASESELKMERQAPIKRRRESEPAENVGETSAEVAVRTDAEEAPQSVQDQGLLYHISHPGIRLFEALNSGFLTDVTILVGDEAIKCHSNIVSCSSSKLATILKANEPRLPDVDPRLFRLLLQIIYTGTVSNMSQNVDTLLQVGRVAHELQVYAAVDSCADCLAMKKMDTENFWAILDFAILIDDVNLKHHCLDTSCIKAGILLGRKGFLNYEVSRLELILMQDTLFNVTELQLFQACVAWANTNVDEAENRRDALDLALRLIRFRLISAEDFAENVCPTGLLRAEDERDILRSLVTGKNLMPEGFSVSTSPRDLGRIMEMKFPSTGERKSLDEFPQGLLTSFIIYANKRTFILGVKLQAWRSNLPEGFLFDEKEAAFCGQVKNGDMISIKFPCPFQMTPYNHYALHVGYSTTEGAANPTYQLYLPEIDFAENVCPTGLLRAEDERDILRSLVTGKNLMPEGFSVSTSPRDLGRIMEMKFPSTGERKPLDEFPQGLQTSFIIYANKRTFILGVKLQAWRSNLPEGFLVDENVLISLQDKLSGKIIPLQEAAFCGQVKNGDMISIKFPCPFQMTPYNHYALHVGYSTTEGAANPTYQLYLPEIVSRDESGMLIRNLRETLAPPDLHIIVAEKVATAT
ncbi:hypothetical protein B566_EDAN009030 [Ephemera danica]|nr:hypothetical protein B566_EDAN009030 [Ephemera danica]